MDELLDDLLAPGAERTAAEALRIPVIGELVQKMAISLTKTGKAQVVRRVLTTSADFHRHPAAALAHSAMPVTWWLDHDAAGMEE